MEKEKGGEIIVAVVSLGEVGFSFAEVLHG